MNTVWRSKRHEKRKNLITIWENKNIMKKKREEIVWGKKIKEKE